MWRVTMGSAHIAAQAAKSPSRCPRILSRLVSITGTSMAGQRNNRTNNIRLATTPWIESEPALWLPTALSHSPPRALQFAHGYRCAEEVPLHAMRDDGRPLRLRKILLPLPIAHGDSPLRRWLVLLPALPRSLQLQGVGHEFSFQLVASGF